MRQAVLATVTFFLLSVGISPIANAAVLLSTTTSVANNGTGVFAVQANNAAPFGHSVGTNSSNPNSSATILNTNYAYAVDTYFGDTGFFDSLSSSESVEASTATSAVITFAVTPYAVKSASVLDFNRFVTLFDGGRATNSPNFAGPGTAAIGVPEPTTMALGLTVTTAFLGLAWRQRRKPLASTVA